MKKPRSRSAGDGDADRPRGLKHLLRKARELELKPFVRALDILRTAAV